MVSVILCLTACKSPADKKSFVLPEDNNIKCNYYTEKDFKILEIGNDNLNQYKKKVKINFSLPKSCYATTLLEYVLQ